jgi:hypothetical protein
VTQLRFEGQGQKENNPLKIENLQKITKLPSKKVLSHENRLENALFTANIVILRFFFAQDQNFSIIHKTDKKFFLAKTKKYVSYDIE